MSLSYNVYKGDSSGGPVDWGTLVANTSSLTYVAAALPLSSTTLFGVRTVDSVTGLEEPGVEAVVRIVVDAVGADVTGRPAPPTYVSARAGSAGTCQVVWSFNRSAEGGRPTGFKLWLTAGVSANYAGSVAATVPYEDDPGHVYRATLTGLADGTVYAIGVRSYNAVGLSVAATEPAVTGRVSTAPDPAEDGSTSVGFAPPN